MYADEFAQSALPMPKMNESTMLEALLKDTAYEFADDITTPQKETVTDMVVKAFRKAVPVWDAAKKNRKLEWGKFREGGFKHLLKIPAFSKADVYAGGGKHIINAYTKETAHGPSWRMIVELTDSINAYGVYPGGQSGNPGSPFYDNGANTWIAGQYYKLQILHKEDFDHNHYKGKITFHNS
jgi:penicillin amidase